MKILLSYSKLHFDPKKSPESHKHWGSSASILARTLYEILSKFGNVTYIDSSEYQDAAGKKFDLFVGIANNFYKILQSVEIKKSIYFAVNMHPKERNWILLAYLVKERLNPKALAGWDLVNFIEAEKGIHAADFILCLGNINAYNSYIKHGVPKSKIKLLNYGTDFIPKRNLELSIAKKEKRYVYVTSEIGLRKGFDIVFALFTDPKICREKWHLDVVGLPTNKYYQKKLDKFLFNLGDKVTYHGWIDTTSPKYWKIISQNDYLVLPSLEEGQAGTGLETLSCGLVPLISGNSGIDYAPLGQLEIRTNSEHNRQLLLTSLKLSPKELLNLKYKTLEYYEEFHRGYKDNLKEAITACIRGELYPKISVVLPIFNKEKTILQLIKLLHRACKEYQNIETHIIFDGCIDKSEQIVREYYRNIKDYKVTFAVTPNLFEIKTNNIGLKKSTGKYCVVLQDDNYIFDKNIFLEAVNFLDKSHRVTILGALAGVNFYPRGTKLVGSGQIAMGKNEVYHRQDEKTNPELKKRIFEVDAVMRGPIFIRKSFLEKYGYLDEIYAPFYMDDMDICFRARNLGFKVYCFLSDVINTSLTIVKYDKAKWEFWNEVISRNADIFYSRWKPTSEKDYLWIDRTPVMNSSIDKLSLELNKAWMHKADLINYLNFII